MQPVRFPPDRPGRALHGSRRSAHPPVGRTEVRSRTMPDVAFVLATVALFGVLTLLLRAVEKL